MWLYAFINLVPGRAGCWIRSKIIPARIGPGSLIWDHVQIDSAKKLTIGKNTSINRGCILHAGGGIEIGDDVLIGPRVVIYSQNHKYHDLSTIISRQGYCKRTVKIKDDVWIGACAIILPGVTLEKGCVVGAGAVVTKDIGAYEVVVGNPAKLISTRGKVF
ncbi:acyltransferase [Nitrosomonas sp.]|uniref:acyltransferase n=1 Tax=Nitrosomonas sp. TaxID=42353 RepID=UPI0037CAA4E1